MVVRLSKGARTGFTPPVIGRIWRCRCHIILTCASQIPVRNIGEEYAASLGVSPEEGIMINACLQVTGFLATGKKSEPLPGETFKWVQSGGLLGSRLLVHIVVPRSCVVQGPWLCRCGCDRLR
jgi:hypothetical protein